MNLKIAAKNKTAATASTRNTRRFHEPVKRFALECMYCKNLDTNSAKHPSKANQLHAAAVPKTDAKYENEFTETHSNTAQLGDTKLLKKLSNNVRSSELYYHNNCHADSKRKYNNKAFNKVENSDITYDEFSGLTSIQSKITSMIAKICQRTYLSYCCTIDIWWYVQGLQDESSRSCNTRRRMVSDVEEGC